jgi:hypothetical protein
MSAEVCERCQRWSAMPGPTTVIKSEEAGSLALQGKFEAIKMPLGAVHVKSKSPLSRSFRYTDQTECPAVESTNCKPGGRYFLALACLCYRIHTILVVLCSTPTGKCSPKLAGFLPLALTGSGFNKHTDWPFRSASCNPKPLM